MIIGWGAGLLGPATFACQGSQLWYATLAETDRNGKTTFTRRKNLDGKLEVFWVDRDVTELWLWDYVVHNCDGAHLSDEAVEKKRKKCRERFGHFAKLAGAEGKGDPFPWATGIVVTHICGRDGSLVHDFIFKPLIGAEVCPAPPLPTRL